MVKNVQWNVLRGCTSCICNNWTAGFWAVLTLLVYNDSSVSRFTNTLDILKLNLIDILQKNFSHNTLFHSVDSES